MVFYVELGDHCRIAGEVLGIEPERVAAMPNIGLAASAPAAPRAAYGEHEAYPTLVERAVILVDRAPDSAARARRLSLPTRPPPSGA